MPRTVVCLGDSITRGQVSANYVDLLAQRLDADRYQFINAGVNNDLSYNALRRLDEIIAIQPDFVTVLIGTNDVLTTLTPAKNMFLRVRKALPRQPSLAWYRTNLLEIVRGLKTNLQTRIGLASLPVIGEDLSSFANQQAQVYSSAVKEIAAREQVSYLPVFERQVEYLRADGGNSGRAYQDSLLLPAELVVRRFLLREDYRLISQREGYSLLTDGVHMNESGAEIIAGEMESFLRACE